MVLSNDNLAEETMPNDDRMTIDERLKYLRIRQKSYQKASRKEKGELLDEMRSVTCLHRKHLIHLLKAPLVRRPRRKQRGCTYGPEMDDALRVISKSYNVCAELQTPGLAQRASHLASLGRLKVNPDLMEQLRRISPSTVRRIYKRINQDSPSLPHKSPTTPNEVTRCIPMRRIPWDEKAPGHLEVDLVSHSGPSASGEFAHTLQMVDVATAWSERVALLGRSALVTLDALQHALNRLPFHPLQFHFDNGSEFMNHLLIPFLRENLKGIKISRSRPYRKNDNRFVEHLYPPQVRAEEQYPGPSLPGLR
jgi:transposase InsO family protein